MRWHVCNFLINNVIKTKKSSVDMDKFKHVLTPGQTLNFALFVFLSLLQEDGCRIRSFISMLLSANVSPPLVNPFLRTFATFDHWPVNTNWECTY